MHPFQIIALTPAGVADARLVLAADRAGCLGIINAEIGALPYAVLDTLRGRTREPFGLKLGALDDEILSSLECYVPAGLGWLVVDAAIVLGRPEVLQRMVGCGLRVIVEATEWDDRLATLSGHHALHVKGHEAGGRIGEETSFILLQRPLMTVGAGLVRGGVGLRMQPSALWVLPALCSTINSCCWKIVGFGSAGRCGTTSLGGPYRVGDKHWRVLTNRLQHRQMRRSAATSSDRDRAPGRRSWLGRPEPSACTARPGRSLCEGVCRSLLDHGTPGARSDGGERAAVVHCGCARSARGRTWRRRKSRHQIPDCPRADDAGDRRCRFRPGCC